MASWLRSLLGLSAPGPTAGDASAATADVTLHVPGMYWASGWPDRVRAALGTLPWVEHATISTDIPSRAVSFRLKEGQTFDAPAAIKALEERGKFKDVKVLKQPWLWQQPTPAATRKGASRGLSCARAGNS